MGIFDRFKSEKKEEKKPAEKKRGSKNVAAEKKAKLKSKKEVLKKPARIAGQSVAGGEAKRKKVSKRENNIAHNVLLELLVTEKSTELGQLGKYAFKVNQDAGKNRVKEAVEGYYGVGVTKVNIVKIRPKKRLHGRTVGWKKGFKKAIVTLQEGDAIGAEGV
jgi:large subunit ribosomal protein L23